MDDRVTAPQRWAHKVGIAHVTLDEFSVLDDWAQATVAVNLLVQPVDHPHAVTMPKQRLANVSANETGAAGDQYASWHYDPFRSHIEMEMMPADLAQIPSVS